MGGIEEKEVMAEVRKRYERHEACLPNQGEQMRRSDYENRRFSILAYHVADDVSHPGA